MVGGGLIIAEIMHKFVILYTVLISDNFHTFFSRAFAEAHTFEIRCAAFWFVAWGVVMVRISQIREVVGGDSFCGGFFFLCVAGTWEQNSALHFPHLGKLYNVIILQVCALSLSLSLVFKYLN